MTAVEVLKVVCWPIVAVIAILAFRKQVAGLLNRVKKLGIPGMNIDAESAAASTMQAESKPVGTGLNAESAIGTIQAESKLAKTEFDAETENRLRQVRNIDVAPIVQEQQNLIRADLRKLGIAQGEQVELLVKHLAVTQLLLRAEFTYRVIFGSQIALLKFLNTSASGTRAELSKFYEHAKTQFPQVYETYSFEQYLHFLLTQELMMTEDHQRYSITFAGQEFLKWITAARVVENKLF